MARVTRGHGLLEPYLAKKRCKKANQLISPEHRSGRVLDIGCGNYPYFLVHTRFSERFGVDQLVTETQAAQFRSEGISLIPYNPANGGPLPFPDEYFNVITMLAVFEHIERAALAPLLREIHRVLQPGGQYILTTPAAWSDRPLRLLARIGLVSAQEIAEHKDAYTPAKVLAVLKEGGFDPAKAIHGYFEAFLNLWVCAQK